MGSLQSGRWSTMSAAIVGIPLANLTATSHPSCSLADAN
jgi:hypothetical protein